MKYSVFRFQKSHATVPLAKAFVVLKGLFQKTNPYLALHQKIGLTLTNGRHLLLGTMINPLTHGIGQNWPSKV